MAVPEKTMALRTKASSMAQVCVIIIIRRRSTRSAMAPPTRVKARMGNPRQRLTRASSNGEPLIATTSQFRAIWSIQSPVWEIRVPDHSRR